MKHSIIVASLFLSSVAFAQAPPPMGPTPEPVAITIDVRTQEQIKTFLAKAPYEFAAPIIGMLDRLQNEAQMRAALESRAKAQPKPEAK